MPSKSVKRTTKDRLDGGKYAVRNKRLRNEKAVDCAATEFSWVVLKRKMEYIMVPDGKLEKRLLIKDDGTWIIQFQGKDVPTPDVSLKLPKKLVGSLNIAKALRAGGAAIGCKGNTTCADVPLGEIKGYIVDGVVRSKSCPVLMLVDGRATVCTACTMLGGSLRKKRSRLAKKGLLVQPEPVSCPPAMASSSIGSMVEKLSALANEGLDGEIRECMSDMGLTLFKSESLMDLLWKQQLRSSTVNPKGMRWHPMIIRFALGLRNKSAASYRYVRESGFLNLPCDTTLNAYLYFRTMDTGIDGALLAELEEKGIGGDCTLMWDEMKVKDKLVYDKHGKDLKGYVDLGGINNMERELKGDGRASSVATHVLVFMVRGINASYCHPIAMYPTRSLLGSELSVMFFDVMSYLELSGFRVESCVCDGASTNRRLFTLQQRPFPNDPVPYRTLFNGREVNFVSDVPHLDKTTRNGVESSKEYSDAVRTLLLHGKPVVWQHIKSLVDESLSHLSFSRLHKLKREHVYLSSYARMRVNLAVQVLSKSVSNALRGRKDPQLESTIELTEKFNDAFDIFNVRHPKEGWISRNPMKNPFKSLDDPRFEWLEKEFLGWLHDWEAEVAAMEGLTKEEKERLLLSQQTRTGWEITCLSVTAITKRLLRKGYQYVLTEKIACQDNLEQMFAHQRNAGGTNHNPTVGQFQRNQLVGEVCKSLAIPSKKGNCRGSVQPTTIAIDDTPLKKRKP